MQRKTKRRLAFLAGISAVVSALGYPAALKDAMDTLGELYQGATWDWIRGGICVVGAVAAIVIAVPAGAWRRYWVLSRFGQRINWAQCTLRPHVMPNWKATPEDASLICRDSEGAVDAVSVVKATQGDFHVIYAPPRPDPTASMVLITGTFRDDELRGRHAILDLLSGPPKRLHIALSVADEKGGLTRYMLTAALAGMREPIAALTGDWHVPYNSMISPLGREEIAIDIKDLVSRTIGKRKEPVVTEIVFVGNHLVLGPIQICRPAGLWQRAKNFLALLKNRGAQW